MATETRFAAIPAPTGMPHWRPRADAAPQARPVPIALPQPSEPFTSEAMLDALNGERPPNESYTLPKGESATVGSIRMLEMEVAHAATVSCAALAADDGGALMKLKTILDTLGFAIVSDVLAADELEFVERQFADDLRGIIDVDRSTAPEKVRPLLEDPVHNWPLSHVSIGTKFASDYGLPHGRAAWYCRSHPQVKRVFESLFGTPNLCVGMDNVFFNNEPSVPGTNAASQQALWPHADQNSRLEPNGKWECYQGVVYVWPANDDTSATVVWPRSHRVVYPQLMASKFFPGNFCSMSKEDYADFAVNARRIPVPAGAMLLWNSKTLHQGWTGGARLAFPVCFEPRRGGAQRCWNRRSSAFSRGARRRTGPHWVDRIRWAVKTSARLTMTASFCDTAHTTMLWHPMAPCKRMYLHSFRASPILELTCPLALPCS
jgi:hypothetical protein